MTLSVTQFGKPLPKEKYTWDEETKVFSSKESNLVIDFDGTSGTFYTSYNCIFKTRDNCTFITGTDCTFDTGSDCVFIVYQNCTFTTGASCVVVRKDVFEVIKIPKKTTIKLNSYQIKGFTEIKQIKTIIVDGKTIEITNKGFEILKKSLLAEIMNDNLDNAVYMASLRREVPHG